MKFGGGRVHVRGWNNDSELRPQTGLLSIPQIYQYGEPLRNDTDRGKPKN
jgi:hypothetical protein